MPLDAGKTRRLISPRLRLALQARDCGCRYPGCGVPPNRTEGHHIRHWIEGGLTELGNLISLCRFHHRRHHEGRFQIRVTADGGFEFEHTAGVPLAPAEPALARARHGP